MKFLDSDRKKGFIVTHIVLISALLVAFIYVLLIDQSKNVYMISIVILIFLLLSVENYSKRNIKEGILHSIAAAIFLLTLFM
jgi:hypothetical protein